MDFFGLGGSADLSTPVGAMVKSGTDSLLIGPDWTKNLEICDQITNSRDGALQATKAIGRRLQDSDYHTVYLALIMMETCMKNCGKKLASTVNRSFMDTMINVAKGSRGDKNAYEALRIIQQWGRAFERQREELPIFFETMVNMKAKGFRFPVEQETPPSAFESPPPKEPVMKMSIQQKSTADEEANEISTMENDTERLRADFSIVMEKVVLCREMLFVTPGIAEDELLAEVVGFLEACRDRLAELIDVGAQGMLSEELLEECLKVNDAVSRTLEAEKTNTPIEVIDATPEELKKLKEKEEEKKEEDSNSTLLDMSDIEVSTNPKTQPQEPKKPDMLSKAEEDIFGSMNTKPAGKPTPAVGVKPTVLTAPKPAPVPAPVTAATATNQDPFGQPFDPFGTSLPPAPTPAPTTQNVAPPPAVPVQSNPTPFDDLRGSSGGANTDLDFLMGSSPPTATTTPAPAAPSSTGDAELDAFFENLGK